MTVASQSRPQPVPAANPLALLTDILLWAFLIGGAIAVVYFGILKPREASTQKITLSLRDANEIAKGSIVRMMGTDIGTVSNISLLPDHVNITIKTFPGAMKIPSGSTATIHFTGLVGAKSIEVAPPDLPKPRVNGKVHVVSEEPIRIIDAFNYQTDIAQALRRGAENMSTFFSQKKSVAQAKQDILFAERSVISAGTQISQVNSNIHQTKERFGKDIAETARVVSNFSLAVKEARPATEPNSLGPAIWKSLNKIGIGIVNTHASITSYRMEDKLAQANSSMLTLSHTTGTSAIRVRNTDLLMPMQTAEATLVETNNSLGGFERILHGNIQAGLQHFHQGVRQFNAFLIHWLEKMTPAKKQAGPGH